MTPTMTPLSQYHRPMHQLVDMARQVTSRYCSYCACERPHYEDRICGVQVIYTCRDCDTLQEVSLFKQPARVRQGQAWASG